MPENETINNTITVIQQHAQILDYATTRVDDISYSYKILNDRVTVLETEMNKLQSQLSELTKHYGIRCDSLL